MYMPPIRKTGSRKPAIKEANEKSFSDRTNIRSDWVGEHRIVFSPSGDMAYEYGTLHMSSDSLRADTRHSPEAIRYTTNAATPSCCAGA
jgi:hypothetical protein